MFAAMEGVCDTPLHIYLLFVGDAVMEGFIWCKFFAVNGRGARAYALMWANGE